MSGYLQDIVAYLGSDYVFDEASQVLEKLLQVDVSAKQVERVSEKLGMILESKHSLGDCFDSDLQESQQVYTYVQLDGSMILTREQQWKEVKLGRVFQLPINQVLSDEHVPIKHSEYVAYLGDSTTFSNRLSQRIPQVELPIFIADGATWIWNWVEKYYPNSVQILDYYHAMEYAHDFAKLAFDNLEQRKSWIEGVKNYLFTDRIEALIRHLELLELKVEKQEALSSLEQLLCYYKNNQHRMYYGFYKEKKLMIGSGAIEASHKQVIQKRLKLSGQRWSMNGAQAILQLRAAKKSDKWNAVTQIAQYGNYAA